MPTIDIDANATLEYQMYGDQAAEPILLICPTALNHVIWDALAQALSAVGYRVVCYDHRGIGGSTRGSTKLSMAGLAADAISLLDALEIERTHVLGWSLGSAVAQEMAIAHPERAGALVLYATWAQTDVFQRAIMTALRHTWATRNIEEILTAMAIVFSPGLINSPSFPAVVSAVLPAMPNTDAQITTTIEQWDADLVHDTSDRLISVTNPTLVVAGQEDLLTPAWQGRVVADTIPGATFEVFQGSGSSHALAFERSGEFTTLILDFLRKHPLAKTVEVPG